ncbi:MAG: BatA domain-containing protein [Brumimicrobium sp.]|nr:BatA domain-containing protein [Brumimicrobium sp.]
MKFLHPLFLWALAILIIPIIIHLFNFRRYKTVYFSSLQFIKKVEKETNSTRKLRHYLILLSRLLAFTCLVLAFARPYIPLEDEKLKAAENITAFYLDNSYSMSARGTNGDLLNHSKETVRSIVDKSDPGSDFMLVTNNLSGIEHRIISKTELLDRLETISFSPIFRTVGNPLNSIRDYLVQKGFEGSRTYIFLSDFQKVNFENTEIQADSLASYLPLKVIPQSTKNIFIDSVWFESPFRRVNQNNTLNVRVKNTHSSDITNAEMNLTVDKFKRQTLVDIPAEGSTIVQFNYTDKTEGPKAAQVEVKDDQLFFDDIFYYSYEVKSSLRVMLVNGEQGTPYPKMVFETDEFYDLTEINVGQLQMNTLREADMIVLNGLTEISSGLTSNINRYLENGGSLTLIPGKEIDRNSYNAFLQQLKLPLLGKVSERELRLGRIYSEHPFFKGMFDESVEKVTLPPLKKHYASESYTAANYSTLVDLENRSPLFVRQAGSLKAGVFYTALDAGFSDFSRSALFSALLLRSGELSQAQNTLELTIGSEQSYTLPPSNSKEETVELSGESASFIPEISSRGNFEKISVRLAGQNEVIKAGNYRIMRGDKQLGWLSLNYERKESLPESLDVDEINRFFSEQGITNIQSREIENFTDIEQLSVEKPNEYWRILLILALLFFLTEMMIVLFWKT